MWEGQKTVHLNMTVMVVLEVLQLWGLVLILGS